MFTHLSTRSLQEQYDRATSAQRAEFNRRHNLVLRIAVAVKLVLLGVILWVLTH
jgi:hypothetical protein